MHIPMPQTSQFCHLLPGEIMEYIVGWRWLYAWPPFLSTWDFFLGDHGPLFSAQERHEWVCAWLDSTWVHQSYGRSDDVLDVQASWKPQDECLSRTRSDLKKSRRNKFLGWTVRENLRRSWTKPYGSLCNDSFTSENNTNTQQIKITCFW